MELPVLNNSPEFRRMAGRRRLPPWLRKRLPDGGVMMQTRALLDGLKLATVCTDARCPNQPECWSRRTAVFMIMGRSCTRHCHYCSVTPGIPEPLADDEPGRVAEAAAAMGLRHVVITSVTRDDLPDEGAGHFARCVAAVRAKLPESLVEVLTPDFHARRECIATVLAAGPAIFNHNIETVRRLTPVMRPQGEYERSLAVLRTARELLAAEARTFLPGPAAKRAFVKSGLILGLGETTEEALETLRDLRAAGCGIVTIGQYLQPTGRSAPVAKFYHPDEFAEIGEAATAMGFESVASGPFVRSSYNAAEVYERAIGRDNG
ncbi:MAG: lipoyl synthase [Phycisphaerae bacterium]|nr:lipoyl synthase [Phycisphaerae bacterium]